MRVGFNPNRDKPLETNDFFHQVIVPVYIPNQEGYFKDSFQILKYCLESLIKTSHSKTYFTIVNNGSCKEVLTYLNQLKDDNKIQEIINTSAIGKLNAILKGLTGHQFDLITISDADVLFLNNWQKAVYDVYDAFAKTGAVCTSPSSKTLRQYTANVLIERFFSSKLMFTRVLESHALKMFAKSIGNKEFYTEVHLKKNLTITVNKTTAIVGAGHFVTTYKGKIFENLKTRYSSFALGGETESFFLDKPVAEEGYWRLSTHRNFTYHMGNVFENWMEEIFSKLEQEENEFAVPANLNYKVSKVFISFKNLVFRILNKNYFWRIFLRYKGLTKEEAQNY